MTYVGSYLWRLRQAVGGELVLMPGAIVALQGEDGRVRGEPRPDGGESVEVRWVEPGAPPEPVHRPTVRALELLAEYCSTGAFQLR